MISIVFGLASWLGKLVWQIRLDQRSTELALSKRRPKSACAMETPPPEGASKGSEAQECQARG
jgi:hypothetical protein